MNISPPHKAFTSSRDVKGILETARGRTVVVLGDLMLDEWIIGTASRISPEAPVPVVRLVQRKTAPGGAANVAMNLLSLGARVAVCGVVGDDEAGADLARELKEAGADIGGLVRDATRPTTLKTRVVAQGQQMVRVDRESDEVLNGVVLERLCAVLPPLCEGAAVLCISDYDKGLAMCGVVTTALAGARATGLRITGGPKPCNLECFKGTDLLSLNQKEASEAAGMKLESESAIERAGAMLRAQTEAAALVITRGVRGVTLFQEDAPPCHIAGHEVEVFDVAGAGDTFLAAASVALAGGADFEAAAYLGNLAGAASVRHHGVVAITPDEVRRIAAE